MKNSGSKIDITQHLGLLRQICQRFRWSVGDGISAEDLEQEAAIAAIKAAARYSAELGDWAPYLDTCVHRRLRTYCRHYQTTINTPQGRSAERAQHRLIKQQPASDTFLLDGTDPRWTALEVGETLATQPPDASQDILADVLLTLRDELLADLLSTLEPLEQIILRRHYFGNESQAAIAKTMGVSRQQVTAICAAAINKLRTTAAERGIQDMP